MKPLVYFDFVEVENNKVMVGKDRLKKKFGRDLSSWLYGRTERSKDYLE